MVNVIPNSEYVKRGKVDMKDLVKESVDRNFSHIVVINEDMKKPSILLYATPGTSSVNFGPHRPLLGL